MSKTLISLLTAFASTLSMLIVISEPMLANHNWGNYHWARQQPVHHQAGQYRQLELVFVPQCGVRRLVAVDGDGHDDCCRCDLPETLSPNKWPVESMQRYLWQQWLAGNCADLGERKPYNTRRRKAQ